MNLLAVEFLALLAALTPFFLIFFWLVRLDRPSRQYESAPDIEVQDEPGNSEPLLPLSLPPPLPLPPPPALVLPTASRSSAPSSRPSAGRTPSIQYPDNRLLEQDAASR